MFRWIATALRPNRLVICCAAIVTAGALLPCLGYSQIVPKVFFACYVPSTGTVYRIKEPGLPQQCTGPMNPNAPQHVEFSWVDGIAAVRSGDAAGGDLSGTYPNPFVAKLQGHAVSSTAPSSGQLLTWNGTAWSPTTPAAGVTDHGALAGLADDDHTHYLLANAARTAINGFAVTGTFGTGTLAASGPGARLVWYPGKGAFRAGRASSTQWDDANIGQLSTALGNEATASGWGSTALGSSTTASADFSTALGNGTLASGWGSTALGLITTASGVQSTAIGSFASTNGMAGAFVYGDASTTGAATSILATAPNQFLVRAAGGTRFKSPTFTVEGTIESSSGGFKFPDGTVQTTAGGGGVADHGALSGLTDDDHLQYLLANGARNATNGFAVTGTHGSGTIAATGAGTRLLWYPAKSAFRAGAATGAHWDDAHVGEHSIAMGFGTTANAKHSVAIGSAATASNVSAMALGDVTLASGGNATAIGRGTKATGTASTAFGNVTTASGDVSTAMGDGTIASGSYSTAIGSSASTNGQKGSFVYGDASTQFSGTLVSATGPNQFVVRAVGGSLFLGTHGSGGIPASGAGTRLMWYPGKSAFRAGRVDAAQWDDVNVGEHSIAMGFGATASGPSSVSLGGGTIASGLGATALGLLNTASGHGAVSMGDGNTATGKRSTSFGTNAHATAEQAMAFGAAVTASAVSATAIGILATASGTSSTAIGACASTNGQQGSFVYGDAATIGGGLNTGGRFCGSTVQATAPDQFVVRASGGTKFYSNWNLTAGVSLAPGGGAWTTISDVNRKENFRELDGEEVLTKISGLAIREWNYRAQPREIRHIGPTAQDFYGAFAVGESDTTITTTDIDGVNLLAAQALERRTANLRERVEQLRTDNAALERRVSELEALLRIVAGRTRE